MEPLNPVEKLNVLEKKILQLIEIIRLERELNAQLQDENKKLTIRLETVESSLLKGSASIDELNQERLLTKMVVDELITSIDKLVEQR